MECFEISHNMKYIIYGAGGNCFRIMELLQKADYFVKAIIDRRAEHIGSVKETKVYTLEEFAQKDAEKENSIIIISVKNVFEHINIVKELLEQGYRNIIYKPLPSLQGEHDREWDSISNGYDIMIEMNRLPDESENKIYASRRDHLLVFRDELLIEQQENQVLCWLPIELVCNYDRVDAYGLLPMAAYYPLVDMYQYLLGINGIQSWEEVKENFYLYSMEWVVRENVDYTESLKNSMLYSRVNIFYEMQKKADIDKDFFARNAVSVKRLDASKFCLTASGRNRVSFLIAKGYRFIPAYMDQNDYEMWVNTNKLIEFEEFLNQKKINRLFATVPHPMLVSYNTVAVDYMRLFGMPVLKEIYKTLHWKAARKEGRGYKINFSEYKKEKEEIKVFTVMQDDGSISRILAAQEMQCYRYIRDNAVSEVNKRIDELLGMGKSEYLKDTDDVDNIRECQILILDSEMDCSLTSGFQGDIVFFLLWEKEEIEESILNKFKVHKLLFRSFWCEKKVSGWMLIKTP